VLKTLAKAATFPECDFEDLPAASGGRLHEAPANLIKDERGSAIARTS
jgi:hypothetical protein